MRRRWRILTLLGLVIVLGAVAILRPWQQRPLLDTWQLAAPILEIAVSADGQYLAVSDTESTVRLWRFGEARPIHVIALPQHEDAYSLAFSPDGKLLAASLNSSVLVWRVDDGAIVRELTVAAGHVGRSVFSPDGAKLTIGGKNARTWRIGDWSEVARFDTTVHRVAYSPDGRLLAGTSGELIHLWDAATMQKIRTLKGHAEHVTAIAFSPDSTMLASASGFSTSVDSLLDLADDTSVRLWSLADGQQLKIVAEMQYGVSAIAFRPDGRQLAIVGGRDHAYPRAILPLRHLESRNLDAVVRFWDTSKGTTEATYQGHSDRITAVAWNSQAGTIVSGGQDRTLRFWKAP